MTVITAVIRGLVMLFAIIMMVSMPPAARAITAEEMLADPALETRARTLSKQLRCLVCQNQSIDDSDADLARDLRREVRTQILTGADDQTILIQLRAKYGDYVLLNPPVDRATLALWFAPVAFIALGGLLVLAARRQKQAAPAILDPEDRERVDRLMRQRRQKGRPKDDGQPQHPLYRGNHARVDCGPCHWRRSWRPRHLGYSSQTLRRFRR